MAMTEGRGQGGEDGQQGRPVKRSQFGGALGRVVRWLGDAAKGNTRLGTVFDVVAYELRHLAGLFLSDRLFVQLQFYLHLGMLPNLDNPRSFSEKLQWLKLRYRNALWPALSDKYLVREFVASRIGDTYLTPLLGVWDTVDQIDQDDLPDSFVLKPTHGSGWIVLCGDRSEFDWDDARRKLRRWMRRNFFYHCREWVYKDLTPRIVCEAMLLDEDGNVPRDYKFFCFDGQPRYIQVDIDRFGWHHRHIYDTDWRKIPMELEYPGSPGTVPPPPTLPLMLDLAGRLSAEIPFCRVDFYSWGKDVRFGEITFFPGAGIEDFRPRHMDLEFGRLLRLPGPTGRVLGSG